MPSARSIVEPPKAPAQHANTKNVHTGTRADIQALRAIAVVLVVLYHFWPEHLTGGFVGVDVFFVISGFLITGHLLRAPIGGWKGLIIFWGRRIRRLLPAAFLVLAVTLIATYVWAPITLWQATAEQAGASALYVQNWFLANEAIDYMAADNAPTAVQHFWSLSIEEQFYLVWPMIIAATAFFSLKSRRFAARHLTILVITAIAIASLAISIYLTATNPAGAYFITWARAWELALGGLAACAYPFVQSALVRFPQVKSILAWAGLALIAYAALKFNASTVFPGIAALIPVAGTALVLLANPTRGWGSPLRLLQWRPVQFLGDISYSLYLWHWPFVILLPYALGRDATAIEKVFAIANIICISYLTKKFVEDRFRGSKPLGVPLRRTFIFAVAGMLAIVLAASALTFITTAKQEQARADAMSQITGDDPCFGSLALENRGICEPHGSKLITDPIFSKSDTPDVYNDDCWFLKGPKEQKPCEYGSKEPGAKRVALVGNSHAGHWLPPLQAIADSENWHITTYVSTACYTVDNEIIIDNPTETSHCSAWNDRIIPEIEQGEYDLVIMSNRTWKTFKGIDLEETRIVAQGAYRMVLDSWLEADTPILVIRDTPYAYMSSVPDCVAANMNNLNKCDGSRGREAPDPLAEAAETIDDPRLEVLDLTDRFCSGDICYSVIGGVIVYFDKGHLSATFARSLAEPIRAAALETMAAGA